MVSYHLSEDGTRRKMYLSNDYNYIFNMNNGDLIRWGKTLRDNPLVAPNPEIMDMEVSTVCSNGCPFCYKSNTNNGQNMSFKTFQKIFDKLPKSVTQIAFGIGDIDANKDLYNILAYTRVNLVIPNITINGYRMQQRDYDYLKALCGSVAVSRYDKDTCYNAVQKLGEDRNKTDTLRQVNIHQILHEGNIEECLELIDDTTLDKRLSNLNAIVFLMAKPCGRGSYLTPLQHPELMRRLYIRANDRGTKIGFDSCSAPLFLRALRHDVNFDTISTMVEPCDSMLFTCYCNVEGKVYPCSFTEGKWPFEEGISILECKSFDEVWNHKKAVKWREVLLTSTNECIECSAQHLCRTCPEYKELSRGCNEI